MPFKKLRNPDGSFKVVNEATGKVHAKATDEKSADSQIRLLNMKSNENGEELDWNTPKAEAQKILRKRKI